MLLCLLSERALNFVKNFMSVVETQNFLGGRGWLAPVYTSPMTSLGSQKI